MQLIEYTTSPSQIDNRLACARKWAWNTIAKVRGPPGKGAELGTAVHKVLEDYLGGAPLDFSTRAGRVAGSGVHLLPTPNAWGLKREGEFRFPSAIHSGVFYRGYRDFTLTPGSAYVAQVFGQRPADDGLQLQLLSAPPRGPLVGDHKTSKSITKYAKTSGDLRYDPQGIVYARKALLDFPNHPEAHLAWVYYQTEGAERAERVSLTVTRSENDLAFAAVEGIVGEMAADYRADVDPLSLPPTPSQCGAYGGCPYVSKCNLSPAEKFGAYFMTTNLSPAQAIMAKVKEAARLRDEAAKAATAAPAPGTAPPAPSLAAPTPVPAAFETIKLAPRESALPPPVVPTGVPAVDKEPPLAAVAHVPPPAPRRTRRTKEQMAAARAGAPTQPPLPSPHAGAGGADDADFAIGTLYIDCAPVGEVYVSASSYYDTARRLVAANNVTAEGLPILDYRYIQYGAGPAAWSQALLASIDMCPAAAVVVRLDGPEARDALDALVRSAERVVR